MCITVILWKSCKEAFLWKNYEIWADFWPDGNNEKKNWGPIMSNFLGQFFQVVRGKKYIWFLKKIL